MSKSKRSKERDKNKRLKKLKYLRSRYVYVKKKEIEPFKRLVEMSDSEIKDISEYVLKLGSEWVRISSKFAKIEKEFIKRIEDMQRGIPGDFDTGLDVKAELGDICSKVENKINEFKSIVSKVTECYENSNLYRGIVDEEKKIGKEFVRLYFRRVEMRFKFINKLESVLHGAVIH